MKKAATVLFVLVVAVCLWRGYDHLVNTVPQRRAAERARDAVDRAWFASDGSTASFTFASQEALADIDALGQLTNDYDRLGLAKDMAADIREAAECHLRYTQGAYETKISMRPCMEGEPSSHKRNTEAIAKLF